MRHSNVVIGLSEKWQDKLRNICPSANIIVLRNAVNLDLFPRKAASYTPSPPYKALFLGRLGRRKGVPDIIEAAGHLERGRYQFTLAGDGDVTAFRQEVIRGGLHRIVDIPGWIGEQEKRTLLRLSDILILPSYDEGLPMSILEAMASGLPIIATPVGGIPEAVRHGENGFLISPGDPEALAGALEDVFSVPGRWKSFAEKSREIAERRFNIAETIPVLKSNVMIGMKGNQ